MPTQKKPKEKPKVAKVEETKEETKKLYRSRRDKVFAGVCGGFAEYLNVDTIVIRILWVVSCFLGGIGLLAYIASWIIIPENPSLGDTSAKSKQNPSNPSLTWGFILIVVGAFFLLRNWDWFDFYPFHLRWHWPRYWFWGFRFDLLLPLALILIGAIYLFKVMKDNKQPKESEASQTTGGKNMDRKLTRSTKDKMIGGVCGGLAAYFNIDVSVVRIGYVLLTIASVFFGVVAYIVMMIVVPEDNTATETTAKPKSATTKSTAAKAQK